MFLIVLQLTHKGAVVLMKDRCQGCGVQISVCGLELWPEARKCEDDWRLGQGILAGTVLMGWTLYIGI